MDRRHELCINPAETDAQIQRPDQKLCKVYSSSISESVKKWAANKKPSTDDQLRDTAICCALLLKLSSQLPANINRVVTWTPNLEAGNE